MDPYEVLGISRSATVDKIKRAYRRLARQYHPDVNPSPDAVRQFRNVQTAYDQLTGKLTSPQDSQPVGYPDFTMPVTPSDFSSFYDELFNTVGMPRNLNDLLNHKGYAPSDEEVNMRRRRADEMLREQQQRIDTRLQEQQENIDRRLRENQERINNALRRNQERIDSAQRAQRERLENAERERQERLDQIEKTRRRRFRR